MGHGLNLSITDFVGKSFRFDSFRSIVDLITEEKEFWANAAHDIGQKAKHPLIEAATHLGQCLTEIESCSERFNKADSEEKKKQLIQNLAQHTLPSVRNKWIWSKHAFTPNFIDINKKAGKEAGESFLNYILHNQISNMGNINHFRGLMYAYEFEHQDSDIVRRRKGEKISLGQLRAIFVEKKTELIDEFDQFKESMQDQFSGMVTDFEEEKESASDGYSELNKKVRSTFAEFLDDSKKTVADLETLYGEKLRLSKPAEYWEKAARRYGIQGGLWALAMLAAILLILFYLNNFLLAWLGSNSLPLDLNSVKGVIIFGSMLAIAAFFLRTLSRLTFGAFHLMRDAEERRQLVYVYLALMNESAIDESSRDVILQALFSRADTGMLGAESSPTMPIVSEVFNRSS